MDPGLILPYQLREQITTEKELKKITMKTITHFRTMVIAVLFITFSACSTMDENPATTTDSGTNATDEMMKEDGNNPDEGVFMGGDVPTMHRNNYVYTESNESGTNHILIFKKTWDGDLELKGNVASGGAGNATSLGSQGAVILDENHQYLYAVNAGSNSISSFEVMNNGHLALSHTIATKGVTPVSLTIHNNMLYVVHSGNSTINGYHLGANGTFSDIPGSYQELSTKTAGPAQISFSPEGNYLYVSEKMTNKITMFKVDANGAANERESVASVGDTPFGFNIVRDRYMIVSNAGMDRANHASVTSYNGIASGRIADINGAVLNGQTSACWVATTRNGRYAYISNTGSDKLSTYYVNARGSLFLVQRDISTGDAPTDITVGSDNYNVFVLCKMDHTIQHYKRTELGGLSHTGEAVSLPEYAAGLASW
jgi:6-phosphogluconolactonase